jgi:hypothetical protein
MKMGRRRSGEESVFRLEMEISGADLEKGFEGLETRRRNRKGRWELMEKHCWMERQGRHGSLSRCIHIDFNFSLSYGLQLVLLHLWFKFEDLHYVL